MRRLSDAASYLSGARWFHAHGLRIHQDPRRRPPARPPASGLPLAAGPPRWAPPQRAPHPAQPAGRVGRTLIRGSGPITDGSPYARVMLVGRSGLSPVMVGRAAEVDRLVGLVDSRPHPSVALVAGEAGIGKTRLVQELVARVPAGTLVLAGQADPGAESRPMELFIDALGSLATSEGPDRHDRHDPALLEAVQDANGTADERVRAGAELVRQLTGGVAGVVVFEDLHWADSESLSVFEQLAEPGGGRLLLVGTYRPDGLSRRHPASGLLPRLERRLLAESEPDVFTFHHDLAREAIKEGLLGRERRRLQEAAFNALRALGSQDHLALAQHARGAGRYDDMVAEARVGARESLARGSTYQARHLAEIGLSEAEDDLELLALAARACWLVGLVDDAGAHCDRWLRLARDRCDVSEEAAALSQRMRIAREAGQIEAMGAFTDQLIGIIDRLPSDEDRARAMAAVAQSFMLRDQIEPTYEWADKATSLAEGLDLSDVRLAAMVDKGTAMLNAGDRELEGRRLLEAAAEEAERTGEHVLAARALNYLVWDARRWSDASEVREMIGRAHRHAEAAGLELVAAIDLAANQAHLEAAEGDLDAAIAQLDQARYTSAGNAVSWTDGRWLAVLRAGLALEAGDLETAQRFTDMCKPPTERAEMGVLGLDFHLACRLGDVVRAREHLGALVDLVTRDGVSYPAQTHDLLSAGLHAGLAASEMRPLADLLGLYVGHRLPPSDPWRRLVDAQLAEAEGRTAEATDLYAAAADTLSSAPEILAAHLGTAHSRAARCLIGLGRLDEARVHAEAAAPFLARWRGWRGDEPPGGARPLGLGAEPSGPGALAPRGREVVSLLAEGLSNSQLAERLYISPRTAAVHVSNILAKLGMSSRTEVAAWAIREGVAG